MNLIILLFAYVFHSRYEGYDMRNIIVLPTILEIKNEILLKKEYLVTDEQTVFDNCKQFHQVKKILTTLEDNNVDLYRKLQMIEEEEIDSLSNKITRCDITKGGLYTFWND